MKSTYSMSGHYDAKAIIGDVEGLYGRLPADLQRLVRKIADAPNYDNAAVEMLNALNVEWRE